MKNAPRRWLIAYDIADPRRLARVHRVLKQNALPVQYSLFLAHCDNARIQALMKEIGLLIDAREDDVRAYPVPARTDVATIGCHALPEGVQLCDPGLSALLSARQPD